MQDAEALAGELAAVRATPAARRGQAACTP